MAHFPTQNYGSYDGHRVNALAAREGLLWDGRMGSPYMPVELIERGRRPATERDVDRRYERLFDHTLRFKLPGSGRRSVVLAVSSPYLAGRTATRELAEEFADEFGLATRVGDPRDVVYQPPSTVPIVFWRPDLHQIVE